MVVAVLAIITLCIWIGWAAVNNYWWGEDSKREMRERLRVLAINRTFIFFFITLKPIVE